MKMHRISLIAFFCFVFFGWVEKFFLTCRQVLLFVRNEEHLVFYRDALFYQDWLRAPRLTQQFPLFVLLLPQLGGVIRG